MDQVKLPGRGSLVWRKREGALRLTAPKSTATANVAGKSTTTAAREMPAGECTAHRCVVGVTVSVEKCRECSACSCFPACSIAIDETRLACGRVAEVKAVKRNEPLQLVEDRVSRYSFCGDIGCVLEDPRCMVEGVRELARVRVRVEFAI